MGLFDFFNDKTAHGIKSKIAIYLKKHKIWDTCLNYEEALALEYIQNYDRELIAKEFLEKEYNYIYKETLRLVEDKEVITHIAQYVDFILPRHYFIKTGNKKDDYNGIKSVYGLKYIYEDNKDLDESMYGINRVDKINEYKKEYFIYNKPYEKLNDNKLYNLLQSDSHMAELYLKPQYNKPFNRLAMLKILHHFYYKKDFDDIDKYICNRDEYYKLLKYESIDLYVIDKEIEIGDFVVFSGLKYLKELTEDVDCCMLGEIYNEDKNGCVKVNFPDIGISEWFNRYELKGLDTNKHIELIRLKTNLFQTYDSFETIRPDNSLKINEIEFYLDETKLFKPPYQLIKSNSVIMIESIAENEEYLLIKEQYKVDYYIVDKLNNNVYVKPFYEKRNIEGKYLRLIEDYLLNTNYLKPFLENY